MTTLLHDIRYAARTLLRSRGFTAAAILTLALGIGANTAVFSVLNGVVLRPLPFPDSERLVYIGWNYGAGTSISETAYKFEYIREHSRVFEGVSTLRPWSTALGTGERPEEVSGLIVSEDFFRVNGIQPRLGRGFLTEEDRPGGPRVVVLGDEVWRTRFDADPGILGADVYLDDVPHTVVGVMPPDFRFPEMPGATDFYVPMQLEADPREGGMNSLIRARILPGVSMDQVRADLAAVTQRFRQEHPELVHSNETGVGAAVFSFRDLLKTIGVSQPLWILLGAVGVVLLIACVNVANLLLVRSAGRRRELAVRAAIGAGRGRIARQLLTESLLLAFIAAAVGLLLGQWILSGLLAIVPADLPLGDEVTLDVRVLLFTLGVAVATGVAFGLTAAVHAWRGDLNSGLREGGARQSMGRGGLRLRSAFVGAQAAFSVVLLAGAGLLLASYLQLTRVDVGFEPNGLVAVDFQRTPGEYTAEGRAWAFNRELLERVRLIPGVEAAATTTALPFQGQLNFPMEVVGRPESARPDVQWRSVSPGYFETLGVEIVHGRSFTETDDERALPVAIVDETFVRKYFGETDPIGQRIRIGNMGGQPVFPGFDDPERVIVGIVADTRTLSLDGQVEETMYTPRAQEPELGEYFGLGGLVLRVSGGAPIAPAVLAAVREVDPRLPDPSLVSMREAIGGSIAVQRSMMLLIGGFAALALILTTIGIYGIVAFTVRQRTGEIGIRIALGASPGGVLGLVVRQGLTPVAVGLGIGLLTTLALTRIIASMLHGVSPTDPTTLATVVAVIAGVSLVATWIPARRAAGVDPVVALKAE